jgi:hypothetical protein
MLGGMLRGRDTNFYVRMDELAGEFCSRLDMIDIDGWLSHEEIEEWKARLASEPVVWRD